MDYIETIKILNPKAITMEGFDDCIIGIGQGGNRNSMLVYNQDLILEKLKIDFGMTETEANEFFAVSMLSYYVNDWDCPIFVSFRDYEK